jgi:hypothetical protein
MDDTVVTVSAYDPSLYVGDAGAGSGGGTIAGSSSSGSAGLHINLIWDSSVASAPTSFKMAVQTAASMLEQNFSDNITVNITVGWGEIGGSPITQSHVAVGGPTSGVWISLASLKTYLTNDASSGTDNSVLANWASSLNPNGNGSIAVWRGQEKALGLITGADSVVDGNIGFATDFPSSAWVAAALHELTHAMGRTSGYSAYGIEDLLRYSSVAVHHFAGGTNDSFSIDGGTTALAHFSSTSDYGDWASDSLTVSDPFNAFVSNNSSALTTLDLTTMDALGFNLAAASIQNASVVSTITMSGIGIVNGNGNLDAGRTVFFSVAMNAGVTVSNGLPSLSLNDGGVANFEAEHSTSSSLVFAYTTAQGDNTSDLSVLSFNLNGASIKDSAGTNANLSGAVNYNPAGTLVIDTHIPVVPLPALQGWTTPEQQTEALYVGLLGRAGDSPGVDAWMHQLDGGVSIFDIALNFSKSAEAQGTFTFLKTPTVDDDAARVAFIDQIYQNLFDRTPDGAGLNYWDALLHQYQMDLVAGVESPAGGAAHLNASDYFAQRIGNFIMNIIAGAQSSSTGDDITSIRNKVQVAEYFTDQVSFRNLNYASSQPATIDNQAHAFVAGTTSDSTSVATQQAAIDAAINSDVGNHIGTGASTAVIGLAGDGNLHGLFT